MVQRILFVCLGNICRSPTAEAIFRGVVEKAHLTDQFVIDSAGTGSWHEGEPPDDRMRAAGARAGYTLSGRARQVQLSDHHQFDHIFAMDRQNLSNLRNNAPSNAAADLHLFRDFDPEGQGLDTPDPYYGGVAGFDEVVEIVARTSVAILNHLTTKDPR